MRKMIASVTFALVLSSTGLAEDAKKDAMAAWEAYQALEKEYRTAYTKAYTDFRNAQREKDKEKIQKAQKAVTTIRSKFMKQLTESRETFGKAFVKTDWDSWDPEKNNLALENGLRYAATAALKEGNFDRALKANKALVAKCPKSRLVGYSKLAIGDILAAQGKVEAARKEYEVLAEGKDQRYKAYAEQKLQLVGKAAPDIVSDQWIGGESKRLSQLKGKVVVIDFWATWCAPCRVVMPGLSKMYTKHKGDGLMVMGVTRFYPYGYMAANPEQLRTGGKSVQGMDEKKFVEHVKAFRDNTKMSYPFVIGNKENFTDYRVRGIPSVAVVGPDGKVALLAVGSGSEPLIEAAVKRLLKKASN